MDRYEEAINLYQITARNFNVQLPAGTNITLNGQPISPISEIVTVNITTPQPMVPAGALLIFNGVTSTPNLTGITVAPGATTFQITKKGTYSWKLETQVSPAPAGDVKVYFQERINGVPTDDDIGVTPDVGTLVGAVQSYNHTFKHQKNDETPQTVSFFIAGDTIPVNGNPINIIGGEVFVEFHENKIL